jgi:hypothetical protein
VGRQKPLSVRPPGETFNRVRAAGASGPLTVRADSGFYAGAVAAACRKAEVRYSITVKQNPAIRTAIAAIDDEAWTAIPYFLDGADVAETTYRPFGNKAPIVRLIVRRVKPTPGSQLALFVVFSYHAFVTDRDGATLELEADHRRRRRRDPRSQIRRRAQPLPIRKVRCQRGLAQLERHRPQPRSLDQPDRTRRNTDRHRHLRTPGRITRSARKLTLHLPARWPWAQQFNNSLTRHRSIIILT